ncbi:MAG: DUF2332 family protein [Methylobacteriaceae bacterium]|nr:DUF2332 family protein [Methylobacteriaceae bacterium]
MSDSLVRDSFREQAEACRRLGSPLNALLCATLAERLDRSSAFGRRVLDWDGASLRDDVLALRCCGAFHAQVRAGAAPGLQALYPPNDLPEPEGLWGALAETIEAGDEHLTRFLDRPPQTNEVARSAVLLGGFLHIARATGLPLAIYEIGASAGLNLLADRYAYDLGGITWGDPAAAVKIACKWLGNLPPIEVALCIAARAGCDANPLDPSRRDDRERLLAYIWPDQPVRLARTQAALDLAVAAGPRVDAADAGAWVARKLGEPEEPGRVRVLFHSIVWQYLLPPTRDKVQRTIEACTAAATAGRPFAWLRMEPKDRESAALHLTIWPSGAMRQLARVDYHGRWAQWL